MVYVKKLFLHHAVLPANVCDCLHISKHHPIFFIQSASSFSFFSSVLYVLHVNMCIFVA